jgi:quercetin dioxygenase-like cupin family protein
MISASPGVTAPKHWHPGEEIIYVLEGSLEY